MAETRNPFLEQATTEQLIALKRDIKREINLRIQRQHSFLAAPGYTLKPSAREKILAAELLAYVDKSEYDNIENTWKLKPYLMFVEIMDKDGVLTTPLKRALYNLDTWTWKPFYDWIQENKQYQPYLADLELIFLQQNDAQKIHVDLNCLQPLFDEYGSYDTQVQKWHSNEISEAEIDKEWKKLFKKQSEKLPFHMIREMCREGDGVWSAESRFDDKTAPKGGRVYEYLVDRHIELDSEEFFSCFGSSLGLVRGRGFGPLCQAACSDSSVRIEGYVGIDADSIRQLCKVRTSDLASIPALAQAEEKISMLRK